MLMSFFCSTAEEELVARDPLDEQKIARFCFMQYKIPRVH
jgi:hypothetical protein